MESFPEGRFDDLSDLLVTIGNFWAELYGGRELVYDMQRANAFLERQIDQSAQELWDSVDRHGCPLFHTELVYPITLAEADGSSAGLLTYGAGRVFGVQPDTSATYLYGTAYNPSWQFPFTGVAELRVVTDNPTAPGAVLIEGLDFVLDAANNRIVFTQNPFTDPRLTPEDDNGTRLIRLYGVRAGLDAKYISRFYGSILESVDVPSSPNYKKLVVSILDAIAETTTSRTLFSTLEALLGLNFAQGNETVEVVTEDADGVLVVTDRNVYRYPAGSTAIVEVGDSLAAGDPLVDTALVYQPTTGAVPVALSRLAIGGGLLAPTLTGGLVFPNAEVPITVTTGVSGKTKITFPLGGDATTVAAFFSQVHATGVAAGHTLANYLDQRVLPVTEPTALNLPLTVNPLKLLFENLLGQCAIVVVVKPGFIGLDSRLADARLLRKLLNPHHVILFVFVTDVAEDGAIMDGDGTTTSAGYDESYVVTAVP